MHKDFARTIVLASILLGLFLWDAMRAYDSTDNKATGERSGMVLFIDHATGCHYVGTGWLLGHSSITPRLYSDGTQVCTGEREP